MVKPLPIQLIRARSANEELDYPLIQTALQGYGAPRDVITRLLARGDLIRIKKGLYVFGEPYRRRLISLEVLANQIYGPSYVSGAFMLQYYGFIPESVYEVTSMTTKKNKLFTTPLGRFSYRHLSVKKFYIGMNLLRFSSAHCALVASPEKALADFIYIRKEKVTDLKELKSILLDDYRIDENNLSSCDLKLMQEIAKLYKNDTINLLPKIIDEFKNA